MRRLALVALTAAACIQHADGTCVWVPGDDGTCSGRGGGGDYDPPPPHVSFRAAAIADGQVYVVQRDDDGAALLAAPIDDGGLPTGGLAPVPFTLRGDLALWPGPPGGSLATMTSYHGGRDPYGIHLALRDAAGLRWLTQLAETIPSQVEAVFDGEAWLIAWSEFTYAEDRYRLQVARVFPDGTVGAAIEPAVISGDDQNSAFRLATDGAGGVLFTWGVRIGWRFNPGVPLERRAVWLHDGAPVGGPWVYAADDRAADACLGEDAALVATADGFHLIATRRHCAYSPEPPRLVDLRIDPIARVAVEAPSPLPLGAVPPRWLAGPAGFVAYDAHQTWLLDAALATAVEVPTVATHELTAVAATATGFVAAVTARDGDQPRVDVGALTATSTPRSTIATDYDLPAEGGCAVGGGAVGLGPAVAVLLLRRRRRVAVPQRGR